MNLYYDFSALLGLATLIAGGLWLIDVVFFKKKRLKKRQDLIEQASLDLDPKKVTEADLEQALAEKGMQRDVPTMPKWADYARSFFPVLLFVFVLRAFIVEPYRIPSGSMRPTLLEGDFILVNKYAYGIRLPLTGTELVGLNQKPQRGDILVFRAPHHPEVNYIKRVAGLPGDTIRYQDKKLYINGEEVPHDFIESTLDRDSTGIHRPVKRYDEQLGDVSHEIFISDFERPSYPEITVPEGHYFVLGDNRDHSADSREWGFVPNHLILGRAFFIWLSIDMDKKDVRWNRLGGIESNDRESNDA